MTYRDKLQKRQRLLHWIMDATYIREHPEMIQRKEMCSLKQKRLCTENPGTHLEQLYTYLIKCINKFKRLILLFIFLAFILKPPEFSNGWKEDQHCIDAFTPNHFPPRCMAVQSQNIPIFSQENEPNISVRTLTGSFHTLPGTHLNDISQNKKLPFMQSLAHTTQ